MTFVRRETPFGPIEVGRNSDDGYTIIRTLDHKRFLRLNDQWLDERYDNLWVAVQEQSEILFV